MQTHVDHTTLSGNTCPAQQSLRTHILRDARGLRPRWRRQGQKFMLLQDPGALQTNSAPSLQTPVQKAHAFSTVITRRRAVSLAYARSDTRCGPPVLPFLEGGSYPLMNPPDDPPESSAQLSRSALTPLSREACPARSVLRLDGATRPSAIVVHKVAFCSRKV